MSSSHVDTPNWWFNPEARDAKTEAHLLNVEIWRSLSGRRSLSPEEQYWTLAADSPEIENLKGAGLFADESQYFGVNHDPKILDSVRLRYPRANLFVGEWAERTWNRKGGLCPKGGIVYFDSTGQPDTERLEVSSEEVIRVMRGSGPNTLLCANFCMSHPYVGIGDLDPSRFKQHIEDRLEDRDWKRWVKIRPSIRTKLGKMNEDHYSYQSNLTKMGTFFYWSVS